MNTKNGRVSVEVCQSVRWDRISWRVRNFRLNLSLIRDSLKAPDTLLFISHLKMGLAGTFAIKRFLIIKCR